MIPRPKSEWHEDMGPVLWYKFPITEPPYVGCPLDLGYRVEIETSIRRHGGNHSMWREVWIGGWPGYHTHWLPLPDVTAPKRKRRVEVKI